MERGGKIGYEFATLVNYFRYRWLCLRVQITQYLELFSYKFWSLLLLLFHRVEDKKEI